MKQNKKTQIQQKIQPLRKAASIILLYPHKTHEGINNYKTLILKRKSTMSFRNSYVFPGGACGPQDKIQSSSNSFTAYSKITAIREFLQESGLLIYPQQSQKLVCGPEFIQKSIEQMSRELGRIWNNYLGYIQPVLRLMTPQFEKGKRFDCIFFLCKAGDQIKVINIQHIKAKMSNESKKSQDIETDLNNTQLLYDKGESDHYIFQQPIKILQKYNESKINMIPPQIILFNWLILLCGRQKQLLNRFCTHPHKNYFEQIQPNMFIFDMKNRNIYIFGDKFYDMTNLLNKQPPSESKNEIQQYFKNKIKGAYTSTEGIRRLQLGEIVIFKSNYNQLDTQNCLRFLQNGKQKTEKNQFQTKNRPKL